MRKDNEERLRRIHGSSEALSVRIQNIKKGGEDKGSLCLRKARDVNMAFMFRANWRFCNRDPPPLSAIIQEKYGCRTDLIPNIKTNKLGSNLLRIIKTPCSWHST